LLLNDDIKINGTKFENDLFPEINEQCSSYILFIILIIYLFLLEASPFIKAFHFSQTILGENNFISSFP
jgi:hypothetical protein